MGRDIRLGYLGFEVRDVDAWAAFAVDVLGLARRFAGGRRSPLAALRRLGAALRRDAGSGGRRRLLWLGGRRRQRSRCDRRPAARRGRRGSGRVGSGGSRPTRDASSQAPRPRRAPVRDLLRCGSRRLAVPLEARAARRSSPGRRASGTPWSAHPSRRRASHSTATSSASASRDRIVCEFYGHPVDIVFMHGSARHHTVAVGRPAAQAGASLHARGRVDG